MISRLFFPLLCCSPVLWPPGADDKVAPEHIATFKMQATDELALSPCEKYLAAVGQDDGDAVCGLLVVWELLSKKEILRHKAPGTIYHSVAFSPNGKLLAAPAANPNARRH